MAKRDYYESLGVPRTASADEIKKAHRKLVRQHHPDVNKGNASSTAKFQEAQEAYDVLSDTEKRKAYDEFGHAGLNQNGGAPPPGYGQEEAYEAFRRSQGGRGAQGGGVRMEDFAGGGENFGGIFEQLFGAGGGRSRGGQAATKGNDIEMPHIVDFRDAARGTSVTLNLRTPKGEQSLDVKIPAGVKDGSRVRIKGKGEPGRGGNGDLFIVVTVRPHAYFKRDDLDITLELPISVYEAMLGATIENVPTLDGPVSLKIPPGTSSGAKLRLAERGFHRGTEKGDQLVIMRVIVPKGLNEPSRATVEAMAKQYPVEPRKDIRW